MAALGPTRKYAALQQVVGYLGYTGRGPDVVVTAAHVASGEQERRMVM
jgi:hypothetical protein